MTRTLHPGRRTPTSLLARRIGRAATVSVVAVALVAGMGATSASAELALDPIPADPIAVDAQDGIPEAQRDAVLGDGWEASSESAITAMGDESGYYILKADAADGYAWSTLAVLGSAEVETDTWVGNYCLTQDGSTVVVVFGPRTLSNDEQMFNEGAFAATVNVATGEVTSLGRGYTLAYFNPGCGVGNTATLTRFTGAETHIGLLDTTTGAAVSTTKVSGQVTSAVPGPKGKIYAASDSGLVSIDAKSGKETVLATSTGHPYLLTVAGDGSVSYVERKGEVATAKLIVPGTPSAKPKTLASGALQDVGLTRDTTGRVYVQAPANSAATKLPASHSLVGGAHPGDRVSSRGEISVEPAARDRGEGVHPTVDGRILGLGVEARALETGTDLVLEAPSGLSDLPVALGRRGKIRTTVGSTQVASALGASPSDPGEAERACAVSRNDLHNQVLQPKPRQVEWAVNRAITGELASFNRPNDWNSLGMPAYSPGTMFPKGSLLGGGRIPAQVVLGVLAQESNLWQASRFTKPGQTGNPLIGNYYGNAAGPFWQIDFFSEADCGYGVGQITDGMRLAGMEKPGQVAALPVNQQRAIALDYTANVAKAVQMLQQKWNETRAAGLTINDGNAAKIENWFFAVWAYNSGFYPDQGNGSPWGVGWLNNPINPIYAPFRTAFLDGNQADSSHPQDWPYSEKVMGFAANSLNLVEKETVNETVLVAGFRAAWWNGNSTTGPENRSEVKPPSDLFCSTVNNCDPTTADGCTRTDYKCWWHGNATWKPNCSFTCGNELFRFAPSTSYTAEQANGESFPGNCGTSNLPSGSLIIDDAALKIGGVSAAHLPVRPGCSPVPSAGTFSLDFGQIFNGSYPSKIDTHQLGGGFNSHFYFTHTRDNPLDPPSVVTGTWKLGMPLTGWTRVMVHLPDHGAWSQQAAYTVSTGTGVSQTRTLLQRNYANTWVSLGVFEMAGGVPSVSLSNLTKDGDGTIDIAWDAVAFQPLPAKPTDIVVALGDSFSSGEGASTFDGAYYYRNSNNGGGTPLANACHRSTESWSRKMVLSTSPYSVGVRADANAADMDFHFLACSGAETKNLLPYTAAGPGAIVDGEGARGRGQYGELAQLDQGYLDANTTLVTLSIGGNDIGFVPTLQACIVGTVVAHSCSGHQDDINDRISGELADSLETLFYQIHLRAPNATIMLMGYPKLFENGSECVLIHEDEMPWLNEMSDDLSAAMEAAADKASVDLGAEIVYSDPMPAFSGKNLCADPRGLNRITLTKTEGEAPGLSPGSQSIHPNRLGTDLYASAATQTLAGVY